MQKLEGTSTSVATESTGDMQPWLSPTADWLSLGNVVLTLFIAVTTYKIKKRFVRKGRIPQLKKDIETSAKKLRRVLEAAPVDSAAAAQVLSVARSEVDNLSEKLPKGKAQRAKSLSEMLKGRRKGWFARSELSDYSEQELWTIYNEFLGVVSALTQLEKDGLWE